MSVENSRPRMIIWRMRIARWVPTSKITPSEYVIFHCFSTATCNNGCMNVIQYYFIRSLYLLWGIVWVCWRYLMWYNYNTLSFLIGCFAILGKSSITFVMSVCPSAHMEYLGSHRVDFHELSHMSIFRIFFREYWNLIKIAQEQLVLYVKTKILIRLYLAQFFFEWEMFQQIL